MSASTFLGKMRQNKLIEVSDRCKIISGMALQKLVKDLNKLASLQNLNLSLAQ